MIIARAPLRIPLGGGGTDYPSYYLKHGGFIVGFALDKYVTVVLHDTIDGKVRLKYSKNEVVNYADELENRVAAEALKAYGITKGIEVATFSDVPESSGLGGSSAFCVALVTALRHRLGMSQDKIEIFASAFDIERNHAEQPGGIQDQYFAALGGAWCLELGEEVTSREVDVSGLLPYLKLLHTNTSRTSLGIAETQIRKVVGDSKSMLESLGEVKALGKELEQHLQSGDYDEIGSLLNTHWETKKKRDKSISNPSVDKLYEELRGEGALGGKLLGLGGGGYLLMYSRDKLNSRKYISVGVDTEGCKVVYDGS